jgi:poly(3-hydroxybutyrate) depolymerase
MKKNVAALLALLLVPAAACGGAGGTATTGTSGTSATTGSGGGAGSTTGAGGSGATGSGGSATAGSGGGATASGATASSSAATSGSTTSSSGSSSSGSMAVPMPKGCVTSVAAGHHVFACDGGVTYDVEIPAACAAGGCGVVLDIHGYTMNAAQEDTATGMRALGTQHGYVVVQPSAPGVPASWDQATHTPLIFAFVSDVATALLTDPKRAHVMGFSQGGGMTWRMVCAHAAFFASASPMSGILGCEFVAPNVPSREVPVLQVHGHKDNVVSFPSVAVPLRDGALAYWGDGAGVVFDSNATHKATRYLTAAGTAFEFWEHDYAAGSAFLGGHCSPGGADVGPSAFQFGCADPSQFNYGQVVMAFFIAHPLG